MVKAKPGFLPLIQGDYLALPPASACTLTPTERSLTARLSGKAPTPTFQIQQEPSQGPRLLEAHVRPLRVNSYLPRIYLF